MVGYQNLLADTGRRGLTHDTCVRPDEGTEILETAPMFCHSTSSVRRVEAFIPNLDYRCPWSGAVNPREGEFFGKLQPPPPLMRITGGR
jgi:hypothetical protein